MSHSVPLNPQGPEDTILEPESQEARTALDKALSLPDSDARRAECSKILTKWPTFLEAWAHLGENARDVIEAYSAFRVGYHRGLDKLRKSGWRGTGLVLWEHPENLGFLLSLDGLRKTAAEIGELDEAERCAHFLAQLDPNGRPKA